MAHFIIMSTWLLARFSISISIFFVLLTMPSLPKLTRIRILQYDFSDPQASKYVCDRRQATLS